MVKLIKPIKLTLRINVDDTAPTQNTKKSPLSLNWAIENDICRRESPSKRKLKLVVRYDFCGISQTFCIIKQPRKSIRLYGIADCNVSVPCVRKG